MTKKKILFIITKSNWGGAQRYVYDLSTSLPAENFDVTIAFGGTGGAGAEPGKLEQKLKEKEMHTIFIKSFMRDISLFKEFLAFLELIKIFIKEKPDVVHLNSSKAGGTGALAARIARVPKIIFTSHGLAWDEDRNIFAKAIILLLSWLTFILCHKVIVVSSDNERRARRLPFCSDKIVLIYNGISPITFLSKEEAHAALAARADATIEQGLILGTISELTKNKGLTYLIDAAKILSESEQNFSILIIGDGEEKAALEAQIKEAKLKHHIHLLGFLPDASKYLKVFDIFTLTSVKEGLPYVLLEAGLAAVPVVASNIAGVSDMIKNDNTGLLFKSKDAADIAAKLSLLINDAEKRHNLGQNFENVIINSFSVQQMSDATSRLYTASPGITSNT